MLARLDQRVQQDRLDQKALMAQQDLAAKVGALPTSLR
jgi:hypothetical protein